uniref:Uncharacterized protein n=1 Tax=Mola mola TaxID=94237 RepID=A0A3Q3WJG7_MOLML
GDAVSHFYTGMSLAGITIIPFVLRKYAYAKTEIENRTRLEQVFVVHIWFYRECAGFSPDVEWVTVERRNFTGIIVSLDISTENCIMVGMAYLVNEWRMLILASARWLLANGKEDAANHYIMKCISILNSFIFCCPTFPQALLKSAQAEVTDKKYTFLDIFKTPNMRKLSKCFGFGVQLIYFGICLNITGFGLSIYLTQFLFATIEEFPVKIVVYVFVEKVGRKPCEMGSVFLTKLFVSSNFHSDKWVIRTVMAVLGKALSEASCADL